MLRTRPCDESIAVAEGDSLVLFFLVLSRSLILARINGNVTLFKQAFFVQIFIALEELSPCKNENEYWRWKAHPVLEAIPESRDPSLLYSSRSLADIPFVFSSSSFTFFARSSWSNLTFQAVKVSTVTGVPRVLASSA
jgi:hypothetical protein